MFCNCTFSAWTTVLGKPSRRKPLAHSGLLRLSSISSTTSASLTSWIVNTKRLTKLSTVLFAKFNYPIFALTVWILHKKGRKKKIHVITFMEKQCRKHWVALIIIAAARKKISNNCPLYMCTPSISSYSMFNFNLHSDLIYLAWIHNLFNFFTQSRARSNNSSQHVPW